MKKRISLLMAAMLVIAAIMSVSVTAFAYDNVDGSEWFTGATLEADGSVKINISTGFTGANGASGYRIAVFDGDPQLPSDDNGFWQIFNGNGQNVAWGNQNGSGNVQTVPAEKLVEGHTYYAGLVGLSGGNWTWSDNLYSFVYSKNGMTGDKAAAKGGTEIELTLLEDFSATTDHSISAWDNNGGATTVIVKNGLDNVKKLVIRTANHGINQADLNPHLTSENNSYNNYINNRRNAFTQDTKAIVLRLRTDESVGLSFEGNRWNEGTTMGNFLTMSGEDDIMLIDKNGLASAAKMRYSAWGRSELILPENFDGYCIIPLSRLSTSNAENAQGDWNTGNAQGYIYFWTMRFFTERLSGSASALEIDNIYTAAQLPEYNQKDTSWTVTFMDGNNEVGVKSIDENGHVELPDFTPAEDTYLVGWFTQVGGEGEKITSETQLGPEDIIVHAYTEAELEYYAVVGDEQLVIKTVHGEFVMPQTPDAPEGKVFKEWNSERDGSGNKIESPEQLDSRMTIYAIFTSIPNTADFSVIAYAAAAVASMGGLIIARKRRHIK